MSVIDRVYGSKAGVDENGRFVSIGGFMVGPRGYQTQVPSHNRVAFLDHFVGPTLDANKWGVNKGSDGAAVNFAMLAATTSIKGTTGAGAGVSMAANGIQLHSALQWKANQSNLASRLVFQARFKMSAITNIAVFAGFTDQVAALEMPVNSAASADTITTNATDAVGVMFDTSMTNDTWWLVGVKNDVDATAQNSALAPVADTFETWRVEVDANEKAYFYRNSVLIGSTMTGSLTKTVALTPVIAAFTRTAASADITVDYVYVAADVV